MNTLPRNTILTGDALERLQGLPSHTVDCVITSPPYFGLRDFGSPEQIGLERTVDGWVKRLREVFGELARVLKPEGSVWLNLGDTFAHDPRHGVPSKSLVAAPERLLLALMAEGWLVRNKLIWHKPNAVPRHAIDRLNPSYDVVYLLTRQARYYFALDLIREPRGDGWVGKKPSDVWSIPSRAGYGGHGATFPAELVRRPILASCPEAICTCCGKPWAHKVEVERIGRVLRENRHEYVLHYPSHYEVRRRIGELEPCGCNAPTQRGVVLDPFFGSGTTGLVATEFGRDWLGIELNKRYVRMARERLGLVSDPALKNAA